MGNQCCPSQVTGGLCSFSTATCSPAEAVQVEQNLHPDPQMFGSTDNVATLKDLDESQGGEDVGPGGTRVVGAGQLKSSPKNGSDDAREAPSSRDNSPDRAQASCVDAILLEIQELWENQGQLEECFENLKSDHQQEHAVIVEALDSRCGRFEEQLNDLTELHQNEILILKEERASTEEKITYQLDERAMDIHEALEACQTRLFKIEQQQQQVVQLEGLENITARPLLGKLINMLLAVLAVILVFVSTVAHHMLSTLLLIVLFLLWRHWDDISEYTNDFLHSTS